MAGAETCWPQVGRNRNWWGSVLQEQKLIGFGMAVAGSYGPQDVGCRNLLASGLQEQKLVGLGMAGACAP